MSAALARQAEQASAKLGTLVLLIRELEASQDVERAVEVARMHAVSALTTLMGSLLVTMGRADEVGRTASVIAEDLRSSVPMLCAGVLGAEKIRAIEQSCRLFATCCQRSLAECEASTK